ncbi:hydroxypyruvate isomerase [Mycobacterium antarcticum]|uniref:hydroxypyruvate isomerase family protein n=1 Tax=Mycolicibacterium sp. TUM20983 TaxID=3023369 RepID=UPI002386B958|nr:TIM barrel protein [Mycolicibacterium sp. TUM20983]GLP78419.1 hydroxypyruvate isomerase [Mycolicibacterium sp. TUM20983]
MRHELPYLANCSIMFTESPLLERPAAAHAAGFDAIEFWWPFDRAVPSDPEVDAFVTAISDAGVRLVGLNFPAGDMPSGDRGLLSWLGRAAEFQDGVEVAVGIAGQLGTHAFNALYGNRLDDEDAAAQNDLAAQNLAHAATAAARIGAVVLLEPVSGAPRYPLRTAADVVAVLDRVERESGADNLRLLADLYHLATNGDDLNAAVAQHHSRIGHVQIADAPGRHEPGSGDLDLDTPLRELEARGYTDWVGLEYAPATTTEAGLHWLPRERRAAANTAGRAT